MQIRPTYPKNLNKGNLTADPYQGITHISYDVLNKTDTTVITSGSTYITYTYDAGGNLLRKKAYNSGVLTQTDYIDGFVYTGTGTQTLSYAPMPEGRLLTTSLTQEYVITDPQGNARVSFQNNSGVAKVTQENSYYGYGLQMPGSLVGFSSPPNKHMYNGGSEWQNDTKSVNAGVPDYYQTFYRNYDPTLGRFIGVDPMAEGSASMGVYHYAGDNPVMGNDPGGDMLANPNAEKYADLDKEEQGAFMGSDLGGGGGGSIYTNPADAIGRNSDPNWMNDGQFDDPGPFSDDHGKAGMQFWAGAEMSGGVLDPTVPHSYGQNAQGNQELVSDPTVGAAPGTNQVRMQGRNSAFDEDPDSWDWGWYKDFRSLFPSLATNILWTQLNNQQGRFPSFAKLWENYPCTNANGEHSFILSASKYPNQCAIRLGYALIESGADLSNYNGSTDPITGYPLLATELAGWISTQIGQPRIFTYQEFLDFAESNPVQGIIYEVPNGGPAHIDLIYNGNNNMNTQVGEDFYKTTKIWYWVIK